MKKLIKLEEHFYIVDDSTIEESDFKKYFYHPKEGIVFINYIKNQACLCNETMMYFYKNSLFKITHSTQVLEGVVLLNTSDIEELVYGYSVEKLAEKAYKTPVGIYKNGSEYLVNRNIWKSGFKAYQEFTKDKLFTIEDMRRELASLALEITTENGQLNSCSPSLIYSWIENKTQSLLPKTEWEVKFVDDKLELV